MTGSKVSLDKELTFSYSLINSFMMVFDKSSRSFLSSKLISILSLIIETAEENITCNAIGPGFVLTELVIKQIKKIANDKKILLALN